MKTKAPAVVVANDAGTGVGDPSTPTQLTWTQRPHTGFRTVANDWTGTRESRADFAVFHENFRSALLNMRGLEDWTTGHDNIEHEGACDLGQVSANEGIFFVPSVSLALSTMTSLCRGLARTVRSPSRLCVPCVRWSSTSPQTTPRIHPSFSLNNKVCLVTGAARGIGFGFCRAFLRSGCDSIVILDLKQSEAENAAEELVRFAASEHMKADTLKVVGLECDVSSEASVEKAFTRTIETFGRVDVAVACAGIVENYSALEYPTDRMKHMYDINVHGVFFTAREAAKYMIPQGGGSIILVASISANIVNIPQLQTPYNSSKAAVKQMASSLAVEWAKNGVRVNALSPGYILTKLVKNILSNSSDGLELQKTWEGLTPLGWMADPEDLEGIIVYLASDASRFMTGSEVRIDGGYSCI